VTRRPKGRTRRADSIGNPAEVMRIATDEETEELAANRLKTAAARLGRLGGKARATKISPERRREIAKQAPLADGEGTISNRSPRPETVIARQSGPCSIVSRCTQFGTVRRPRLFSRHGR